MGHPVDKRKEFIFKISENYFNEQLKRSRSLDENSEIDLFLDKPNCCVLCFYMDGPYLRIINKLPEINSSEVMLVFYKIRPDVINEDNVQNIILVCSLSKSTVNTLYQTLQKVFIPALFKDRADRAVNIKLQTLVTNLETGLKTAVLQNDSLWTTKSSDRETLLSGILSLKDECDYWNFITNSDNSEERDKAQNFLKTLQPISVRFSNLKKLTELEDLSEDTYNAFDDIWKLDEYRFPQERMRNLLEITGNELCQFIQDYFKDYRIWENEYYECVEFLTLAVEACDKWSNMCNQLTTFFWPNYSLHKWSGEVFSSVYFQQFIFRLNQIIGVRTIHQNLQQILTKKEQEQLNIEDNFKAFAGINPLLVNPYSIDRWNVAIREFEENLKPLEEQVGNRLKEQIRAISSNTLQLLEWFKRYQDLIQLSGLRNILKPERQTLLVLCQEYVNNLFTSDLSSPNINNESKLIYEFSDIPSTVANIMWIQQLQIKINGMQSVCKKVTYDLNGYESLQQLITGIKEELQTSRLSLYNQWLTNTLSIVNSDKLSLKTDEPVVFFGEGKSMRVNYNPQLVGLIKEVRQLKLLKFNISSAITDVTELAQKFMKQAKALEQVANFHNTIGDRMVPSQRPMMLNTALELSKLVKTQHTVTWSEINEVDRYIEKLQSIVEKLAAENALLYSYHDQIMQKVIALMGIDLIQQKNKWRDTLREIRDIISEVGKKFSNTKSWCVHWDYQLYKALECQYQIGLENLNHYLPEIKLELVYRQQSLQFSPSIEEVRIKYYNQLKKFLTIPCSFQGVSDLSGSIFPKMVEKNQHKYKDVYEKGEQLFDRLFSLRDEWFDRVALGSVDMDTMIQENLKTADDWDTNFRDSKAWGQEIAKIISCDHKIDCFVVSTAPVRSEIELHNHRYWDALATSLYASIMFDVNTVDKFINESRRALEYEPQTLVEIGDMNNAYSKIVESAREISEIINEMDKKNKTLASWTKERVARVQEIKQAWSSFQATTEDQQHVISRQVESMKSKVLTELENLMTEIDNFILRWKQMRPKETDLIDEKAIDIGAILKLLEEKRIEWNLLSSSIDNIRKDCGKFGILVSEFPDQTAFENDLKQCEELWGLYADFASGIEELGSEEWIVFRSRGVQKFEKFLQEWQERLEIKPTSPLVAKLLKDLQTYKDFVPSIKFVRGDAFSEKHWSELCSILGMDFKRVDKLTFGDFLAIRESVKQNISYLQELNNRASSEIVVRQALAELDIWEVEAKFSFISHTDGKGQQVPLIKDFKDILTKVGDNQCLLQSIAGSSNYDQFSDRIKLWETRLNDVDYYLRSISELQRKWLYLQPIFGNETMTIEKARFSRVDKDLRHVLTGISCGDHRVVSLCRISNLKQILDSSLQQLNICQKSLNEYLEDKRLKFPRFYFLSDEDLLEILGQANKPEIVQSHLKKLFAGIHSVTFDKNCIVCMNSLEGETVVLRSPIMISLDVEKWLEGLVAEMRRTLQELLIACLKDADPLLFPSQILCLAEEISFTTRCERAIETNGLKQLRSSLEKQLHTYTSLNLEWSSDKESAILEIKLKALILDTIYHTSIVDDLIGNAVISLADWHWQRRMRHYLKNDGIVIIRMVDAEFTYSYEYQGNASKLVHTPLTDKCYLTLTQAMHMGLGGNPYGPAGTGKTESVKALGRLLGRQVLVFNCDEGLDFHSLARILIGLVKCGAWGCFDEFNRLEEATLSAISMHILAIQESLKNNRSSVTLLGKQIELDKNTGIFVTLNPACRGYGGRQKLPDNLKQLFRPISMSQPDDKLIAEVILYSEGFKSAEILAVKLVQIFDMCKRILSRQKHYDWGLRALKTVIGGCRSALKVARETHTEYETDEASLIVQVLRLNTLSKLTFLDANQFDKLVRDVFPGISFKSSTYDKISKAVEESFPMLGLTINERQIHKCLELYEQLQQRMGVVVVGPPGAGKSVICKLLKQALLLLGEKINQYTINPKSMARTQLLGQIDLDTRRWIDGVLSTTAQKVYAEQSDVQSWIIFDGDVDPEWIESLNSVLDDNRLLTLPSGWRIQFGPNVHFIFETDNLDNASPATVSRMGIVLLSEDDVDIKDVVSSWIQHQSDSQRDFLSQNIKNYMYKALDWIKAKGETVVHCSTIAIVNNLLSLLSGVSTKPHFAMMLIAGLGSNLTPASKKLFAYEVLKWTGEFIQSDYNVLHCYYNSIRDCIDVCTGDSDLNEQSSVVLTAQMKSVNEILYCWIEKREPFLLIGPPGCGKSVLLDSCVNQLYASEMVTVHCSANVTPYRILQKMSQVCMLVTSNNGRTFRPKNSERLILHLKDLNLTRMDKWGSSMLVSFLQQVLSYGGYYDQNEMEWILMEQIHIIATLTSCESLSPRFVNLNRIISLWPTDEADLKFVCVAHIRTLSLGDKLHDLISTIIVKIYIKVKEKFTQEYQPHYVFTPRDLIRWAVGIRRYVTDKSYQEILQSTIYEGNRLFEDRLSTNEDKIQYATIVKSVLSSSSSNQVASILEVVEGSVFIWNENSTEPSLEKLNIKEWTLLLQKYVTQLENNGEYVENKILLPQLAKMVAYTERILTGSGSSLIMSGRCGYGRKTAVRIVAARTSAHLLCPKVSYEYSLMNFKNDMKSALQIAGIENQIVYYMLEDYQLILPEMLDYASSLLASGEIPELYHLDEFETLCAPLKDVVSQNDFNGTPCQYFTQRVLKNLRIILILDFTNPNFKTYLESNPVLLKKCSIIWLSCWHSETMQSIPRTLPASSNFDAEEKQSAEKSSTIVEEDVLAMAINFHESFEKYMNVTPRHFNLFIRSYIEIKKHKQQDIMNTASKLKAGLSKLTQARSVVADLKSDAAQQETKLAEKQNKATTALELITKTMQNASTQKNEMEVLKENVEKENVALTARKKEIDAELAEIEPLIAQSSAAVGNIKPEALTEIRSLRAPPEVIRDILEGVLRLMGIQDTSWNSMKTFLSKRGVKEDIRNFDARSITTENRQSVEQLLLTKAKSFDEKTAKRASTAAAPLAIWIIANVKYSQILEKILPLEKEQAKLHNKLKDAEDEITLLSTGLDNVDQTVSKLKEQLNVNTKEAAEIEVRLNKAKETISAAEDLVVKLDEEYSRWGEQITELSKSLEKLPFCCLLAAASVIYLAGTTEKIRKSVLEEWQLKVGLDDFSLQTFLSTEQEQLKWISNGLPSDYLSLQNAVIIAQVARLDVATCNRPLLMDPTNNAVNWLKQHISSQKTVECITQHNSRFATALELAIRFGKALIIQDVTSVNPILIPVLRGNFIYQGTRKLIQIGEKLVDYNDGFQLFLWGRETKSVIPPNISALLITVNFATTHTSLSQQLLKCALSIEKPELEKRQVHLSKREEELKLDLYRLQDNILKELANAQGNILDNKDLLSSLNETKKGSLEIKASLSESEKIKQKLIEECDIYKPLAEDAAKLFFSLQSLQEVNRLYQISASSFIQIYSKVFSADQEIDTDEHMDRKQRKLTHLIYQYVSRFLFRSDRLTFALYLTRTMFPQQFGYNEWELFTRQIVTDVNFDSSKTSRLLPPWIHEERVFDVILLKETLPELYNTLKLENSRNWESILKGEFDLTSFPVPLSLFQTVLVSQALNPGIMYSVLTRFSLNVLGLNSLSPPPLRLDQLLAETSSTQPILLITSPGADPSEELRALALSVVPSKFCEISLSQGQTKFALEMLLESSKNGSWLILKNLHLITSWLPTLEKEFQSLVDVNSEFRLWLASEPHPSFPTVLTQLCLKITYEAPQGLKRNLQRSYNQLIKAQKFPSVEYAKTVFTLAWFHGVVQERRTYIPQGWRKFYEFNDSDLLTTLGVIQNMFTSGRKSVDWNYIHGLCENAIYGGRIDNEQDLRVLKSYLQYYFNADIINSGRKPLIAATNLPTSVDTRDYLSVIQKLSDTDMPRLFFLPLNVDCLWQKTRSDEIINTVKILLQGAAKIDNDDIQTWKSGLSPILHLWKQLNQEIGILKMKNVIKSKKQLSDKNIINAFLSDELEFGYTLVHNIHKSLVDINKALRSACIPNETTKKSVISILSQQTPENWLVQWDGSANPMTYIRTVMNKVSSIIALNNRAESSASILNDQIDLSEFFNAQTFLSILKQYTARTYNESLDNLILECSWGSNHLKDIQHTIRVAGLLMEGARFDAYTLSENMPDSPTVATSPPFDLAWISKNQTARSKNDNFLPIPLYQNPSRENIVTMINVPAVFHEHDKWIQANVAFYLRD